MTDISRFVFRIGFTLIGEYPGLPLKPTEKTVSLFTVTDSRVQFTLTDAAATKVAALIAAEETPDLALRVAVRPGGCSGFSYEMFFDADVADDDMKSEKSGVTVVIDPASFQHLGGGSLDYRDGLEGSGFHISNPNAERTCGCGSSFS